MYRKLSLESERNAWIFLNHVPYLGSIRFHRLLQAAKSARAVLKLSVLELQAAEVPQELAEHWHRLFQDPQSDRWLDSELSRLAKKQCEVVTELDEGYPAALRELLGRPPVLYYKGRWPISEKAVGLVGSRHPSEYGKTAARRFAEDLAQHHVATVSGLAKGIDTCVHQGTLQAGGWTVAVLGCGLGRTFPQENAVLQARVAEEGTLVSEFPYEAPPDSSHFPRRNRIISGLSKGVAVIEARVRSGALITARCAAEQGRDVFAVPGSVFQPFSAGCHRLIRQGACLIESAYDILDELGMIKKAETSFAVEKTRLDFDTLSPLEKRIAQLLSQQPLSADEITHSTSLRFEQVADSLLSLELKGFIRTLPGQRYAQNEPQS
jgi:DNA processing protein